MRTEHSDLLRKVLRRIYVHAIAKVGGRREYPISQEEQAEIVARIIGEDVERRHLAELLAVMAEAQRSAVEQVHVAMHETIPGDHDTLDEAVFVAMNREDMKR